VIATLRGEGDRVRACWNRARPAKLRPVLPGPTGLCGHLVGRSADRDAHPLRLRAVGASIPDGRLDRGRGRAAGGRQRWVEQAVRAARCGNRQRHGHQEDGSRSYGPHDGPGNVSRDPASDGEHSDSASSTGSWPGATRGWAEARVRGNGTGVRFGPSNRAARLPLTSSGWCEPSPPLAGSGGVGTSRWSVRRPALPRMAHWRTTRDRPCSGR
jgi:hypothetical protein